MKTVFITGGTRGVGKSLVEEFCKNGYNVLFCYEKSEDLARKLEQDMASQGYKCTGFKLDVSNEKEVAAFFENLLKTQKIDCLVNNAGIGLNQKMLVDVTQSEWQKIFDVNVNGVFYVTKAVVKSMMYTGGRIINIGSMWGEKGASCEVCYSASKGAIISFTKALAKELASSGVTVNCLSLGVIDTDMNSHLTKEDMLELANETPLSRLGTPSDVSPMAVFLCSDKASFITGQIITIDGGFTL